MADIHQLSAERNKISVIVPVYNAEEWLREALKSLVDQTHSDLEVIMVNDGSTDSSEMICREFAASDSRFRLISQSNSGVSAARNIGIEEARGEWLAFLDADDVMPPDSLELLFSCAYEYHVGIVVGKYVRNIPDRNPAGKGNAMTVTSEAAILLGLYQNVILNSPCGVLYHRSVFTDPPALRFRKGRYEDLDLFYRAFERVDRICILDRIVYYYRDNPESFINVWSDSRLDVLDVTDKIVEHMQGRSVSLYKAALDRRFSAHFNMLVEMLRHGVDNKEQKDRCLKIIKSQRLGELTDGKVRLKNKLGALASYMGLPAIKFLCRF